MPGGILRLATTFTFGNRYAHYGSVIRITANMLGTARSQAGIPACALHSLVNKHPKNMNKQSTPKKPKEQAPRTPGPTTGGMRSMGPQPGEPTLEEKLGVVDAPQDEATKQQRGEPKQTHGVRQGPPPVPEERYAGSRKANIHGRPHNQSATEKDLDRERRPLARTDLDQGR